MPETLLIDNGSSRPESTLALRALARSLGDLSGRLVHPVSLLHADRIAAHTVGGQPADTLEPWLRRALAAGRRDFLLVPLWFGPSRALTEFIPTLALELKRDYGPLRLRCARELCPLPGGELRLVDILFDHLRATAAAQGCPLRRLILVDHGSPRPEVTAVRNWLAAKLRDRLGPDMQLYEAAMERRAGVDYDFNGERLEGVLQHLAAADPTSPVILPLLFLSPGHHAGPGGDLAAICGRVQSAVPGFRVYPTQVVGTHPALIEILAERMARRP
ncbi:CbiX/SirB N-terminal domain-containing protein [uncultured Thiodictyon sp.]|uniref:sirohydrochlorin chelatase n=1 Tax=uncultured Thiodictyon sp. TaxID=1846217 RepID=UPI0025D03C2E|nr:CbiX/SirB N-terminal domain-containing protein [uncultured Thiodictyon sp.]